MKNARSRWRKTPMRQRSVHSSHSSAIGVENASRRRRCAMANDSVPMAKTKRNATSESREDVRPIPSHADRVNACLSTNSATQSFHVAMEVTSRRISADPRFKSSTPSKDPRALLQHVATATVRSSAATDGAEAQQSCVQVAMDVAMDLTSHIVLSAVSSLESFSK